MFKVKSSLISCKNKNQCNEEEGEDCVVLREGAKLPSFLRTLKKRRNNYNKFKSKKGLTLVEQEILFNCTRATGTSIGCCHKKGKDWERVENKGRNISPSRAPSSPKRPPSSPKRPASRSPSGSPSSPSGSPSSPKRAASRSPSGSPSSPSESPSSPKRPASRSPSGSPSSPKRAPSSPSGTNSRDSSRSPSGSPSSPKREVSGTNSSSTPKPPIPTTPKPEIPTTPKPSIPTPMYVTMGINNQPDTYENPQQFKTPAIRQVLKKREPSTTKVPPPLKPKPVVAATSGQIRNAKINLYMEKPFGVVGAAVHKLTKKIRGEKNNITRSKMRKHFMRIMNNPERYNTSQDCNVKTIDSLREALTNKFQDFPTPSDLKIEHKIFPYLGEMINKLPKRLRKRDRVNYPSIPSDVLDLLTRVFNVNFSEPNNTTTDVSNFGNPFTVEEGFLTYPYLHQQEAVKNFVDNIEVFCKSEVERKNLFVVTHNNFLLELLKFFNKRKEKDETLVLDNLDILHIMYDITQGFLVSDIYRWSDNYKPYVLFRTNYVEKGIYQGDPNFKPNQETRHLFFMRHCAACHNHPKSNIIQKAIYKSYGSRSMCFSNTFIEIKENIEPLNELFNEHGGLDNFVFGSSIIFRALLTGIVVQQQLKLLQRRHTPELTIHPERNNRPSPPSRQFRVQGPNGGLLPNVTDEKIKKVFAGYECGIINGKTQKCLRSNCIATKKKKKGPGICKAPRYIFKGIRLKEFEDF